MKLEVLYEDENIVALNKPSGLLSIPDRYNAEIPNLQKEAIKKFGALMVVHRLDRETSGVILFAKNAESHKHLSQLFESRDMEKFYLALVQGRLLNPSGTIDAGIMENPAKRGTMMVNKRGKPSVTDYETIKEWGNITLLKLQLHTGRTHQIRVHLQHLGHAVLADAFYGDGKGLYVSDLKKRFNNSDPLGEERPILGRLGLHASTLKFKNIDGKEIFIEAPLPKDMRATIQQLDKWYKESL